MNFYKHFIGDYQRDTMHLSFAEDAAYRRLLDVYYATENPLPADPDPLCRIARAFTDAERAAVDSVVRQFFKRDGDVLRNARADREIAEAQPKIKAARENGRKGGRPRERAGEETQEEPSWLPNGKAH
jgi:uncharacterized protein YdaU (DUF1376 family)